MKIILFSGVAQSGKDTCADYLVKKHGGIKVALADQLKVICRHLIKLFYNIDIPIGDFYDINKKDIIIEGYPCFAGKPFTIRTVLQVIGTEVIRDGLWNGVWCDYVNKKYVTNDCVIIICDCRFQNEIDYFEEIAKQRGGEAISIRLIRDIPNSLSTDNKKHSSETGISSLRVTHEIHNSGTKEELYQKLDKIFISK